MSIKRHRGPNELAVIEAFKQSKVEQKQTKRDERGIQRAMRSSKREGSSKKEERAALRAARGHRYSRKTCFVAGGITVVVGITLATSGSVLSPSKAKADDLGSGLTTYSLSASAGGIQFFASGPVGQGPGTADGGLPFSAAQLRYGPSGHALSSVFWPGTVGGNFGSLLLLSGLPTPLITQNLPIQLPPPPAIPAELNPYLPLLNSPIRAETSTGGDKDVSNTTIPGAAMQSRVDDGLARATAQLNGTTGLLTGSQRDTRTLAQVELVGSDKVVATAESVVTDITLPGGIVKIGTVVSYAKATSDGTTATLDTESKTQILNASIAGIPVTIDENGVTVQGSPVALKVLTDTVNKALEQAGIALYVGRAVKDIKGNTLTYDAGALVITLPEGIVLEVGGSQVGVSAIPAGTDLTPDLPTDLPDIDTGGAGGDGGILPGVDDGVVTNPDNGGDNGTVLPGNNGTNNPNPIVAQPAGSITALPSGLGWGWIAFVVLGAGMIAAGMRRLPDTVLAAGAGACTLTSALHEPVELDDSDLIDLGEQQ